MSLQGFTVSVTCRVILSVPSRNSPAGSLRQTRGDGVWPSRRELQSHHCQLMSAMPWLRGSKATPGCGGCCCCCWGGAVCAGPPWTLPLGWRLAEAKVSDPWEGPTPLLLLFVHRTADMWTVRQLSHLWGGEQALARPCCIP